MCTSRDIPIVHLLLLLLLFHVLDVFINQDWPSGGTLIVLGQIRHLVAKVQKGGPLIQSYTGVSLLLFHKGTKGVQTVTWNAVLQHHVQQGNDQFLVQSTVGALAVELKAKLWT